VASLCSSQMLPSAHMLWLSATPHSGVAALTAVCCCRARLACKTLFVQSSYHTLRSALFLSKSKFQQTVHWCLQVAYIAAAVHIPINMMQAVAFKGRMFALVCDCFKLLALKGTFALHQCIHMCTSYTVYSRTI
jgi:hypothetical protein